jgi:hypothetical protein
MERVCKLRNTATGTANDRRENVYFTPPPKLRRLEHLQYMKMDFFYPPNFRKQDKSPLKQFWKSQ